MDWRRKLFHRKYIEYIYRIEEIINSKTWHYMVEDGLSISKPDAKIFKSKKSARLYLKYVASLNIDNLSNCRIIKLWRGFLRISQ